MNQDYVDLKSLQNNAGYKKLEALWLFQISKIEQKRDTVASKNSEDNWKYWAGQEKGFKLAMTALERAIAEMVQKEEDIREEENDPVTRMMQEIRLKGEPL